MEEEQEQLFCFDHMLLLEFVAAKYVATAEKVLNGLQCFQYEIFTAQTRQNSGRMRTARLPTVLLRWSVMVESGEGE